MLSKFHIIPPQQEIIAVFTDKNWWGQGLETFPGTELNNLIHKKRSTRTLQEVRETIENSLQDYENITGEKIKYSLLVKKYKLNSIHITITIDKKTRDYVI